MSTCGLPTRILFAAQELTVKIKEIESKTRIRAGKAAGRGNGPFDNALEYHGPSSRFPDDLPGLAGRVGLLNRLFGRAAYAHGVAPRRQQRKIYR